MTSRPRALVVDVILTGEKPCVALTVTYHLLTELLQLPNSQAPIAYYCLLAVVLCKLDPK